MGKHKKKFIDKKEAVSFQLVHRSQRDPLQADNDASGRILQPISKGSENKGQGLTDEEPSTSTSSRREEHEKFGIFFDDDYDYMQHLRTRGSGVLVLDEPSSSELSKNKTVKEFGNIRLPGELFASEHEEEEGMLSKGVLPRGPQPDWDPDVVACLDDAIDLDDPDNILEDDFILKANAKEPYNEFVSTSYRDDEDSGSEYYDSEDEDVAGSDFSFSSDERKSQGTHYSMTSSVIRRTQELKVLDDRFDRILEEYEDEEIGALEGEEITGYVESDVALGDRVMEEMMKECPKSLSEVTEESSTAPVDEKLRNAKLNGDSSHDGLGSDEEPMERVRENEKEQWDCESILSTYSNLYNHPKLICEPKGDKGIRLTKRLGIPVGVLENTKPQHVDKMSRDPSLVTNVRNKGESQDEKKQRKKAVKEERKLRRSEKKSTKLMFKTEHMKQEKVLANSKVQQGLKI